MEVGNGSDVLRELSRKIDVYKRQNLMKAYKDGSDTPIMPLQGKKVAVVGDGNVAMDCLLYTSTKSGSVPTMMSRIRRRAGGTGFGVR